MLDQRLVESPYLCGDKITLGDVIIFNELSLFMELCDLNPQSAELSEHINLIKWFNIKMKSQKVFADFDEEMKAELKKVKKKKPEWSTIKS